MSITPDYVIHKHHFHNGWDNAYRPAAKIGPGEVVQFEITDASGGQITETSTVDVFKRYDPEKVNPVTGPIYIDNAEPGDTLKISVLSLDPSGWGWTAILPDFGLLADQFKEPHLHLWHFDKSVRTPATFCDSARVPLKPMIGTIGVAPAEEGFHSILPPRNVGGNMDIRDLNEGAILYLPVAVTGALFSVGDTHTAQGDGEVCGTAIESAIDVALKFDLIKGERLKFPRMTTAGPVSHHLDTKGYEVTTGIGPDLMAAAQNAVSAMIDLLTRQYKLTPEEAYMLCSVCGDLKISEVVDKPNWVVSFYFPKVVFE